jgi:energy-coupling factor transport system substrate-specific component
MFQAIGAHGPVLGPISSLVLDALLLGVAFWMLSSTKKRNFSDIILFISLITVVSLFRVIMTPLPNIQPVTLAALLVGAQLGAKRGIAFAVLVTMISNFIIGDGIWTLYQAIGWSAVAVIGAKSDLVVNNRINYPRIYLAAIGTAFLFDFIVSLSILDGTVGFSQFMIYLANGIPYDLMHALGNLTFAAWFSGWFVRILRHQPTLDEIEISVVEGYVIESQ